MKSKLTYTSFGVTASVELNEDASMESIISAFKGILVANTWSENTIREYLAEEYELHLRELNKSYEISPMVIEFGMYLTGHDSVTIEQMFNEWTKFNNK
jgi:hypothetical protein